MKSTKTCGEVSVILHYIPEMASQFARTLTSVFNQFCLPLEILVLCQAEEPVPEFECCSIPMEIILEAGNLSRTLNRAVKSAKGKYLLYIDNSVAEVILKHSLLDVAGLMAEKYPELGMLYGDYDLVNNGKTQEIRLLKHHSGRLRDNQDYGKVFLFNKAALEAVGGFDPSLKYNTLYDIRLKLSEKYKLVHIANKIDGSLYQVASGSVKHNVFDYLLASKEAQLEAEVVLTNHLKRIGAYLAPDQGHHPRPDLNEKYDYIASVIIPVYHRPEFIGTALDSVFDQSVKDLEIIVVVNGGPLDPTVTEVRRYMAGGNRYNSQRPPVRLVVADINNIGFSLNLGVKVARGRYYVQLDSDDRLKPSAIEKIVAVFNSDEKIGMVIGSYEVWEKKPSGEFVRMEEIPIVKHEEWTDANGRNNLLRINGAGAPRAIPIKIIQEMGYFGMNDEPYACNYGEDYDLVLKISEKYRIGRVWEPIYEVVRHSGGTDHNIDQLTIAQNDEAKDYMRLKAVQRRKKLNGITNHNQGKSL
ncbi:MAG TPA: glycosyltransferase family A protein [Candidatus Marinimicrobia bacterium]|nr:glycosyltransferase family A protein [Candidatus Neomarinimicrobiota bacterium]HRS52202.1 glycosyltransferase family A protein [Candidatus Neomarinimicrobiota bacterium]